MLWLQPTTFWLDLKPDIQEEMCLALQIYQEVIVAVCAKSWKPVARSAYTAESRGKTNFCAPRDLPGRLRTHKGRSPLGQGTSSFCLCPELIWTDPIAPCTQILGERELNTQKFRQSWDHRTDCHFYPPLPNPWPKRKLHSASGYRKIGAVSGRNLLGPACAQNWTELVAQLSVPKSRGGESWTLRSADAPENSEETTLCPHSRPKRKSPSAMHRDQGAVRGRTVLASACAESWKPVTRSTYTTESRALCSQMQLKENRPTGALTHRPTGGSSHCQETARQANTRDNQRARGKRRNLSNRNQDYLAWSEPSSPTTTNTGYPNTPEKKDLDIKSHFMMRTLRRT